MVSFVFYYPFDTPISPFIWCGSFPFSDAMSVHCLLMMDRIDLAGKLVRKMQGKNEDALPCQLALAEFHLAQVNK